MVLTRATAQQSDATRPAPRGKLSGPESTITPPFQIGTLGNVGFGNEVLPSSRRPAFASMFNIG